MMTPQREIHWKTLSIAILISIFSHSSGMTIDKEIFSSASKATLYKLFHMMPGGEVKVMTEFDLLLSQDQYTMLNGGKSQGGRGKRKALQDPNTRWKHCKVYYEILESLDDEATRTVIQQAINEWQKYTCLQFIESSSATRRIQFQDATGCYSELGMRDKPQTLGLARGCRTKGVVVHEIGHAIGFYHEHMRPDRDTFIHVNYDVIPSRFHSNFYKKDADVINTYDVPYDYTSIMHYGASVLPNSIITLDDNYQGKIGQRVGLTFKDIKLANLMYRCANVMNCERNICQYDGFILYKNYKTKGICQCWCDSGDINDPLILCSKRTKPVPPPVPKPLPTKPSPSMECFDLHPDCDEFKARGQCMSEMELMMEVCPKSCSYCGKGTKMCMDHEDSCKMAAAAGLCKVTGFKKTMEMLCPASCDLCLTIPDACEIQMEMVGDVNAALIGVRRVTDAILIMAVLANVLLTRFLSLL